FWQTLLKFNLNVLICFLLVSSSPPKPINVSFSSVNLRNVLHWFPGNGTPEGTLFTVQYAIKGKREHWRAVDQCTKIIRTWCDLSAETRDEEERYYARVRALGRNSSSKWTETNKRFDPKSETILGPPLVSVEIENNSAVVTINGPVRYSPNNHTPALTMKTIYHRMSYNLSIFSTHRNQVLHFPVENSLFKYHMMDYNTEYCFSAKSRFLSIPLQSMSSVWHCITTPQDPIIMQLQRVVVGIVVPSLCICIIVLVSYLLYNYLSGKEQTSPPILPQAETFGQSPTQTEVSALLQRLPCSPGPPVLPSQTQAPTQSNQRSFSDKQTIDNNTESSALWFTKNLQTGTFNVHLNLPLLKEEGKREEIKGGEQKQNQCENVPLLSEYASQVIPTMPTVHSQRSDCLSDEYGALIQAKEAEAGHFKRVMCSNWNPEDMQEMLPMPGMTFNVNERLGGMQPSDSGKEDNIGGTFEGMYMTRNHLKLENVLLRQTSDEEAGSQIEEEEANGIWSSQMMTRRN
uniref:Fibronectin type-III domain-containing protein n=1 Tax=Xiphophorus couchianus TaxID=32473 RepID=A0A3B5LQK1_9TELE